MQKVHIKKNSVQETLIIPLYARKLATQSFPDLFRDDLSIELIERLDYDFSSLEKKSQSFMQRFGALEVAMRQNDLAYEVIDYLNEHPSFLLLHDRAGKGTFYKNGGTLLRGQTGV